MGVGREGREPWVQWILKILAKIGFFLVLSGKTKFHQICPCPLQKNFGKSSTPPSAKNPFDKQVQGFHLNFDFSTGFAFKKLTKETSTSEIWKKADVLQYEN